jgi:hypothetical protein
MLPVSMNCPFLIDPSVFSSVYLINTRFQRLPAANGNTFIDKRVDIIIYIFLKLGLHDQVTDVSL